MRTLFLPHTAVSIFTAGRRGKIRAVSFWRLLGAGVPRGELGRVCLLEQVLGPNGREMRTPLAPLPFRLDGREMRTP